MPLTLSQPVAAAVLLSFLVAGCGDGSTGPKTGILDVTVQTTGGDLDIDGYHGYFTFYLGEPEAKVNLYFMGGAGATHLTAVSYTRSTGQGALTRAGTEFSTTWGSGLRYNAATHFALKAGVSWTPTYIKSNAVGWWCDPWWGCYVVGNAQYMNQIHFEGGVVIRY